jgi:hypothetical protein
VKLQSSVDWTHAPHPAVGLLPIYRGIVQYYLLAGDVYRLHRLRWVMETSMLKTLAGKHRTTVSKIAAKHKAKIQTPHGPRPASRSACWPWPPVSGTTG